MVVASSEQHSQNPTGESVSSGPLAVAGAVGQTKRDDDVHLLQYWFVIRGHLGVFAAVLIGIIVLAVAYALTATPIYRGQCRLLIEPSGLNVTQLEGVYDPASEVRDMRSRESFLQTQIALIKSDHLLAEAFTDFEFGIDPRFRGSLDPLKAFGGCVNVNAVRNTYLVDIAVDWPEEKLAADVANHLAQLYVEDYRERQLGLSGKGVDKLKQQLVELEKSRHDALEALSSFKKQNGVIDLDDAQDLLVGRMTGLNEALIDAQVDEAELAAAVRSIAEWKEQGGNLAEVPEVLQDNSLTTFRLEELRARGTLLELLTRYGETHPSVKTQNKIITTLSEAVTDQISNSIESVRLAHERSRLRHEMLRGSMGQLEDEVFALDEHAAQYRILEDACTAAEKSYRMVINRINEINITRETGELEAGGNIMIIDPAVPPKKRIAPQRKKIVAIAGLAGLILAAGVCLLLDYLDSSVKSKEEAEEILGGVPVLGFVPSLTEKELEVDSIESMPRTLAEGFRTIRTSLGLSFAGRQHRTFVVTSAEQGDGKTLTAFNLALALARGEKRVLLMELDMRRPRLKRALTGKSGDSQRVGMSQVLVGAAELGDVLWQHPEMASLQVAFCGPRPPNPAELLGSAHCEDVIQGALEEFDYVVVDSPPVLNVADASILAGLGLPILFVVRAFRTDRHHVLLAAQQIRTVQGTIVGAVMNNYNAPRKGYYAYYYGGRYYYYQSSSYHYGEQAGKESDG